MVDPLDRHISSGGQALPGEDQALPCSRTDVEITEQVYYGKSCYVLKDPVALRYYRLRPPEYTIYRHLDGKNTLDDILKILGDRFPQEAYDRQAVISFMIMLRGANLLLVPGADESGYLLKRKKEKTRGLFQRLRQEFLFFRIPILDPDKLLSWLYGHGGRWFYTRAAGIVTLLLFVGALALLLDNVDKLGERQPLLSWINLLYLGPALLLIKFIHEFGHGLTSKHFGSEVHEMGVLFLVFMPCFYCDVSDSWMVPRKGHRMWITAAGILVELVLAALAAYLWAYTEPRTVINQFALNVMLAASLNTFLFNGNPLLRYDGYYFLMDMMEIPNLKQKSTQYLWYLVQRYVLGSDQAQAPIDVQGREITVLSYGIISGIYRWFVMFAIIAMVWTFLDPYGWGVVGGLLAVGSIFTAFVKPVIDFVRFVFTQYHRLHVRLATAIILAVVLVGALYLVLVQDIEQSVETQCILRPREVHVLYVTQPGWVESASNPVWIKDGQQVEAGAVLLKLTNPELETQLKQLELELDQLKEQKSLAAQQGSANDATQIEAKLKGRKAQAERLQRNVDQLTIRTPSSGIVQLRTREPMRNLNGAYLPLASALFAIYTPGQFKAVAAVDQRDYGLIQVGQPVEMKLWALDAEDFTSRVEVKPPDPVRKMSSAAFSTIYGGEVQTLPAADKEQAITPARNTYEFELPLESNPALRDGMVGRAKFIVERKTLAAASYRWLIRTLRLDFRL